MQEYWDGGIRLLWDGAWASPVTQWSRIRLQCQRDTGDVGLIPWLGRSSGEGNDNLLQYSCLENHMDRGSWQATLVQGVTKGWKHLKLLSTHARRQDGTWVAWCRAW